VWGSISSAILKAPRILVLTFIIAINVVFGGNINEKKQVIITFDDGYYSVYKYAYPILKKYKIPITFALITSYLENGKVRPYGSAYLYINKNEVKEMVDSLNIEIASHSVTHRDLTKLSTEEARYEIEHSKKVLDSLFNQETTTFVYPYGAVNHHIVELTKAAGYKLGRSIYWGEPNLWVDRYLIPIKEIRMSTPVEEVVSHIKYHKTTVLLLHRIMPKPAYFTEWGESEFATLIQILKSDPNIEFLTLKDLYNQWWQDIMGKYLLKKGWINNPVLFQKIDVDQTGTFNPRIGQ
jgi:peptidoglycan/xylan/chitin deacetylase (PgdA/CDA1 family)